jgi:hypothetical protein
MNKYQICIFLIFTVKIIFIILSITNRYLIFKKQQNTVLYKKISYWKNRTDFIFVFLMSLLLIYLFFPTKNNQYIIITGGTQILLFIFGIILIITAKWNIFLTEAKWFKILQQIIG